MAKKNLPTQKYEYCAVTISETKSHMQWNNGTTDTTTIVFNTAKPSIAGNVGQTLNAFAVEGWWLKSNVEVSGEVLLIFERHHDEFNGYNNEILKFIQD